MVPTKAGDRDGLKGGSSQTSHRNAENEGEAARQLLEANGYTSKAGGSTGQLTFRCPFHEGPGELGRGKSPNFYMDKKSSVFYCQAASCGERGNLVVLERFFGIDLDPTLSTHFQSREVQLQQFQAHLTPERRKVFYEKGLVDATIDRFRYGWTDDWNGKGGGGAYVIPYLEGRRPRWFRYYDPTCTVGPNGSKYWWEAGSEASLYNPGNAVGDGDGRVFICEGETKAALLCQMGYYAVAVPGAAIWKPEWSQLFNHAKIIEIVLDNDNPSFHRHGPCHKCQTTHKEDCQGHNPGQDAAARLLDALGYRAKNVVLPRPDGERKVDINEYFTRDGKSKDDFEQLYKGLTGSPYRVKSLREIRQEPPPEAQFIVGHGILPKGGRLLVSGAPKVGKSIFVENLCLSIAAGIPFLGQPEFTIDQTKQHRVLLLDREVSERSLFDRLNMLIDHRPGYAAAEDYLHVDHKIMFKLDQPGALDTIIGLIRANNADVLVLDTAYKFFSGDMESSKSVAKALSVLDEAIAETGISVVLTHHHRKGSGQGREEPSADQVVGSFLWTGWPNGTVLLNPLDKKVSSPFNTVCSFVAFRDAAPPDPLALYRNKESIAYTSVVPHRFDEESSSQSYSGERKKLTFDSLADFLLQVCPIVEEEFLHIAAGSFGANVQTIRTHMLDILDRHPDFYRDGDGTRRDPFILKFRHDVEEEPWEPPAVNKLTGEIQGQTALA